MADDGLLINFELPSDGFLAPKARFQGGWRDRLKARKSYEYGRNKAQERAAGVHQIAPQHFTNDASDVGERPTKRQRSEVSHAPPGNGRPAKSYEGEVISSLFTYNPSSKPKDEVEIVADDSDMKPSNAPLEDELSTFTSLGLSPALAAHLLRKMDIKAPTAIQRKAIEQLCKSDTDAFIQSQTGSGKTLAYLLPIVERITAISKQMKAAGVSFDRHAGLFAIILAPTRELSKQISTVLEDLLSCCHWIVGGIVIGGEKKKSEKARLRKGLNILVATPGRLVDHLSNTEVLDVSQVRWLVLDEGDRLMELGFEQDIQKLVSVLNLRSKKAQDKPTPGLPENRTTVLCSATIKADVEQLSNISLKNSVSIAIDPAELEDGQATESELHFSAPSQLKQSYAVVPAKQRLVTLTAVLKQTFKRKGGVMKCILFISCADSVDFHFELLTRGDGSGKEDTEEVSAPKRAPVSKDPKKIQQGTSISETRTQGLATGISSQDSNVQLFRLHGSLPQHVRTSTLAAFTKCTDASILVCTDVAARGLDLPNIDLVIEYDPPFSKDDHLHRIGRTARAGKDGRATIFLQPGCEENYVRILKESRPRNLTRHEAEELLKKGFGATIPSSTSTGDTVSNGDRQTWEDRATEFQLDIERWALEHPKHLEQARRAFQSHVRAYATHVSTERDIFNMQELHLGHLAKAFALRDKPGSIRVPGLRPSNEVGMKGRTMKGKQSGRTVSGEKTPHGRSGGGDGDEASATNLGDARRTMMKKIKSMSGASEFNLG